MRQIVRAQMLRSFPDQQREAQDGDGGQAIERTYVVPMPNMQLSITFFPTAVFNPQRTGIGRTTAATSRKRLKILMKRSRDFSSPQDPFPPVNWSHR